MSLAEELSSIDQGRANRILRDIWGRMELEGEVQAMSDRLSSDYPALENILLHFQSLMRKGKELADEDIEKYTIGATAILLVLSELAQTEEMERRFPG